MHPCLDLHVGEPGIMPLLQLMPNQGGGRQPSHFYGGLEAFRFLKLYKRANHV